MLNFCVRVRPCDDLIFGIGRASLLDDLPGFERSGIAITRYPAPAGFAACKTSGARGVSNYGFKMLLLATLQRRYRRPRSQKTVDLFAAKASAMMLPT